MSTVDKLSKKFGSNLNESLGARTAPKAVASSTPVAPATVSPDDGRTRARETGHMEIERIVADPKQPRKEFDPDALDRLAASIKRHGQLLPARVRWDADLGKWVIISGERRFQAAKRAGMKTLTCVFVDRALTEQEILAEQIVENLLREDLKPIEQADAYKSLMAMNGWSGSQLAEALHISKATVSRVLALLKLPDDIKVQVDKGELPSTAAYEVAKLPTADAQRAMATKIVTEGFTRSEAIEAIRNEVDQVVNMAPTPPVAPVNAAPKPEHEFRGETHGASTTATNGAERSRPSFAAKLADTSDDDVASASTQGDQAVEQVEESKQVPAAKKPVGKPRTGTKERSFRVDGAKVVVTFLKKIPDTEEVIAALEQAIAKLRAETQAKSAA
jgi:ParB family transcriptional regulator, chromosome partitioning protein